MVTIVKKFINTVGRFGGAPYGNACKHLFSLRAGATGILLDSDKATPPVVGDVIRIGVLNAGLLLADIKSHVTTAFTAATTAKLGFAYVDGVDSATVPQNDSYFNAALVLNAVGKTELTNNAVGPIVLPKDAYLILTWAGATNAAPGALDVVIDGIETGAP